MSNVQTFTARNVATEVVEARAGHVTMTGKTVTERKLAVVHNATTATRLALSDKAGKIGAAARAGLKGQGLTEMARLASFGNYQAVAEYFSAELGQAINVRGYASFASLPDRLADMAQTLKEKHKTGGHTEKDGALVPVKALALLIDLELQAMGLVQAANEMFQARKEAKESAE